MCSMVSKVAERSKRLYIRTIKHHIAWPKNTGHLQIVFIIHLGLIWIPDKFENFNYLNVALISYKVTMWD